MFDHFSDIEILEQKIILLEKSNEKVRKSLFAKHGALCKQYLELNDRFNVLEKALCRGKFGGFE